MSGSRETCEDKRSGIFAGKGPKAYTVYDEDIQKENSLDQMLKK